MILYYINVLQSKNSNTDTNLVITGDLIIVMGQIITACQMVYEEKFIYKYNVPSLQAVGWEGQYLRLLVLVCTYLTLTRCYLHVYLIT